MTGHRWSFSRDQRASGDRSRGSKTNGRISTVASDPQRLRATYESRSQFTATVDSSTRASYIDAKVRRSFWRLLPSSTVAGKLVEFWCKKRHFGDGQFLYRRNSILLRAWRTDQALVVYGGRPCLANGCLLIWLIASPYAAHLRRRVLPFSRLSLRGHSKTISG